MYDDILDRANKFFENHTFEVYYLFDSEGEPIAPTNVKVKLTGVKEYISMGDYKPFIMYYNKIIQAFIGIRQKTVWIYIFLAP